MFQKEIDGKKLKSNTKEGPDIDDENKKKKINEMDGLHKDLIGTETYAVKDYKALMVAKKEEEATLSRADAKFVRIGELGNRHHEG